MSIIADCGEK